MMPPNILCNKTSFDRHQRSCLTLFKTLHEFGVPRTTCPLDRRYKRSRSLERIRWVWTHCATISMKVFICPREIQFNCEYLGNWRGQCHAIFAFSAKLPAYKQCIKPCDVLWRIATLEARWPQEKGKWGNCRKVRVTTVDQYLIFVMGRVIRSHCATPTNFILSLMASNPK